MDIEDMVSQLDYQLRGMTDLDDQDIKVFSLDFGEIFLKTADGRFFKLAVDEITAEDANFIDEDSWS